MERFNLKKLNVAAGKEQYHIGISIRWATLENLNNNMDINRGSETVRESIKIPAQGVLYY
jgi:hypothetical protein